VRLFEKCFQSLTFGSKCFITLALLVSDAVFESELRISGFRFAVAFLLRIARGDDQVLTHDDGIPIVRADDIIKEWRLLWSDSIDDKVRAETLARKNFQLLFVEQGTVIKATRNFKPLDLREILHLHKVQDLERVLGPCPSVGGWAKFAKTVLNKQNRIRRYTEELPERKLKKNTQRKKGGRGWVHKQ